MSAISVNPATMSGRPRRPSKYPGRQVGDPFAGAEHDGDQGHHPVVRGECALEIERHRGPQNALAEIEQERRREYRRPAPAAAAGREVSWAHAERSSRSGSTPTHWTVLRAQASARASTGPAVRSPHSLEDLLELLPKPFQLADLKCHGVELRPNQRSKSRTERQVWVTAERTHECLELLKREPQGAGSTDEPQPLHAGLIVQSVARRGAARGRQHPDLFVVANRLRGYTARLGDLANREAGDHGLPPSVEVRPTIDLPATGRSREKWRHVQA